MTGDLLTTAVRALMEDGQPIGPLTVGALCSALDDREMEGDRLRAERDALAAALAEIADGGCTNSWTGRCPPGDRCDPCTAQAALDATGGTP